MVFSENRNADENRSLQGAVYAGVGFKGKICGVSILRAGEVSRTSVFNWVF